MDGVSLKRMETPKPPSPDATPRCDRCQAPLEPFGTEWLRCSNPACWRRSVEVLPFAEWARRVTSQPDTSEPGVLGAGVGVWDTPGSRLMTEQELRQHLGILPEAVRAHEPPVFPRHALARPGFPGRRAAWLLAGLVPMAAVAGGVFGATGHWALGALVLLLCLPALTWQSVWGAPDPDYRRVAVALRKHVEEMQARGGMTGLGQLDTLQQEFVRTLDVAGELGELG